ncbi:YiiX/YebB-like N1pC/P60 family cysteine hydrolase [Candidatus Enterococcus clewellii]|uniref:Uncharacterized protein n=1 Tax=Candidatus Enterococcus clewellii TaxID=1834193 RepID=A0A242K0V1_9ENTE|nr:YiiX/YebB-like N1pC/P60 family cysteine hydrolase [Enterococcus sp. 9E7_DIV0242]OTP10585.1 hypothetical protein A5888_003883 [Enterococcus sp. 9E7_DIV0242]
MKKRSSFVKVLVGLGVLCIFSGSAPTASAKENKFVTYTPKQLKVLAELENKVDDYLAYGENAPIEVDVKSRLRAKVGAWSWRDGVICVTDAGSSMLVTNSWHAGIVAPQKIQVVAEAEGVGKKVRLQGGNWNSRFPKNKVWQVGVKKTSVAQDLNAGRWAGKQVGKPYNLNFWNIKQTGSFYCSQLAWAAYYYTAKVDLDKTDNNIGSAWAVHPGEFVNNSQTSIIYRNK